MLVGAVRFSLLCLLLSGTCVWAQEVNESPLPIEAVQAFPKLRIPRPVLLTHAGDGTNRVFVASQYGKILVFPNDQGVQQAKTFLDIEDRVEYKDRENEEGLLGLAFHPQYRSNGELFVYYTTKKDPHTSVVSRFKRSADNPDLADPDSEQEILRLKQPFWNHNGGTIAFGPDGFLYIGLGDGGKANDPLKAGQDLSTWLGSILRIDIDRHDPGKAYAVPADNPFVNRPGAKPEIWAYGVRNIWRLSFDRKTGDLWAADVGQNLWEEINIVTKGGNYGWNLREAMHKFGADGAERSDELIDPIWEYHHSIGKSITGGHVYRGKRLPELDGYYIYGDYVSGLVWGLKYDRETRKVLANRPIEAPKRSIMSFGEDEQGEVYFTTDMQGGTIYWLQRS